MMGPAAATLTPSAYVLEESVWYVFMVVAFEKNVINSPDVKYHIIVFLCRFSIIFCWVLTLLN